jgi:Tfp pilus assembly protein PilF
MVVRLLLAVALAGVTALVYAPVARFDFVSLDDPLYITDNDWVLRGLDAESVEWAFTRSLGANWMPLTFLSHMLDVELFGLDSGAHHRTNLLLHVVGSLLLFGVLGSMTGRAVPAALVAAAFALHPLHVESVAWVTERKDVLSGVFAFATIGAYLRFARLGGPLRYALVVLALALGLMSKAMLVTLPFVLLLLDVWPLGRIEPRGSSGAIGWLEANGGAERPGRYRRAPLVRLVIEKLPLLALVGLCSMLTYVVQQQAGAMIVGDAVALSERLQNALYSYARYLELHLWPSGLSVQVPHPFLPDDGGRGLSSLQLALAAVLLAIAISAAIRAGGAAWVGLAWFAGMLVPVIGLVQVGPQGMADRYSYLPSVGLFIAIVWPLADVLRERGHRAERLGVGLALCALAALAVVTSQLLPHWRGALALFERAIAVNPQNYLARYGLAKAYRGLDRNHDALQQYRRVLETRPQSARAHNGAGAMLREEGELALAIEHLEHALELQPTLVLARGNLGLALRDLGDGEGAERELREAVRLAPEAYSTRVHLAHLLREQGRRDEAIAEYRRVLERRPDHVVARRVLATLLAERGERDEAEALLRSVLADRPGDRAALGRLQALEASPKAAP